MYTNRTKTNNKIFGNSNGCGSKRSLKCTQKVMNYASVQVHTCVYVCVRVCVCVCVWKKDQIRRM